MLFVAVCCGNYSHLFLNLAIGTNCRLALHNSILLLSLMDLSVDLNIVNHVK